MLITLGYLCKTTGFSPYNIGMSLLLETPYRIQPCLLEQVSFKIADLATALAAAASQLGNRLHLTTAADLADLVRVMNCYYSNLIEGHNTLPRDIERALANQLDSEGERRDLQIEARAHIAVQKTIDAAAQINQLPEPASVGYIKALHQQFYADASPAMLEIELPNGSHIQMQPGQFRIGAEQEVSVGRHLPPSPSAIDSFMAHFAEQYRLAPLGMGARLIAMAAAHHRLNYIHPFMDGNGRVSRLMSHAMGHWAGIGAQGLWSISRGLARGLESRGEYKRMMDRADMPRQGDLDGRGNLSLQALEEFIGWFLKISLDQVTYMASLFDLDKLAGRLKYYVERRDLDPAAVMFLQQVLHRGEIPRGEFAAITGMRERKGRDLLGALLADGILQAASPKRPVSLRFASDTAEVLFPALFPEM
jgi:Fic family protein